MVTAPAIRYHRKLVWESGLNIIFNKGCETFHVFHDNITRDVVILNVNRNAKIVANAK